MGHNLPEDFVSRIRHEHADSELFLAAIGEEPSLSVRLNPSKGAKVAELALGAPVAWSAADGFYLGSRPQFTLMPELHAGAFYVQEASSMYLSHVLEFISAELPSAPQCLDLCAAPGGKTTLLMSFLQRAKGGEGLVVANEYVRQRAWVLRENVAKWGFPGVVVTNSAAKEIAKSGLDFDLVLVDAPCSGEGMFRKDEGARAEWSTEAAEDCAERQRAILADIWGALRPGGYLVYSTCTFNPEENERNMEWATRELGAEPIAVPVVEGSGVTKVVFDGGEGYAFYPHRVKGEGFFVCLLRKTEGTALRKTGKARARKLEKTEHGSEYVEGLQTYLLDNEVIALPQGAPLQQVELALLLNPILTGTPVCTLLTKGQTTGQRGKAKVQKAVIVPSPELPLSNAFRRESLPNAEVDKTTALKFLHGDTDLQIPNTSNGTEWTVLSYNGLNLGIVKHIGARLNNYYPKEWRIRKQLAAL